jgi:multiple sugar transport system substrate-binding protein
MGREGEVVAELMDGFHAENPDIRVHVQQIPWTAAHEKLLTAYVGGAMPDVAQLGNTWVSEFAAIRALAPLGPWIERSPELAAEEYFAGIWSTNVVSDTVWGVPWYVDTRVIFYRTDLLAQAGYDSMPQTWDGWVEAMHAIKRVTGPDRYAIFLPTNEWAQPAIFGLQNGSTLLAADGTRGAFSEPAFRAAFNCNNIPIIQAGSCGGYFKTGMAVNVDDGSPDLTRGNSSFACEVNGEIAFDDIKATGTPVALANAPINKYYCNLMNAIGVKAGPDGFPQAGGTQEVTHYGMYDDTTDFISGGANPPKINDPGEFSDLRA